MFKVYDVSYGNTVYLRQLHMHDMREHMFTKMSRNAEC